MRACGPRRRPRSRCLKSLLSTPGWRVYLLSKKFKEILGSFLCFFCAFRFLFIFFIKWDITVILQLRRGLKFGRLFERESDAAEFPFVIWTPANRIKKRMSSPDDAYRHHPLFVDQNTTEGTLRSCGVSVTEIFRAQKFSRGFAEDFINHICRSLVMSSELSEKLITWLHSANQKARNSTKIEKP